MSAIATGLNRIQLKSSRHSHNCAAIFAFLACISDFSCSDFDSQPNWKNLVTDLQELGWLPSPEFIHHLLLKRTITGEELNKLSCWLIYELGNTYHLVSFTRLVGQEWRTCRKLIVDEQKVASLVPTEQPAPGQLLVGNHGCCQQSGVPKVAYDFQDHSLLVL